MQKLKLGDGAPKRAMKRILLILTICISTSVFGQQEPEIIAKFKDTERIGNFLTRWYYDILGNSLVWKKSLTLYSDSTYRYVYQGGECGTFDEDTKGIWKQDGQLLILDNELTYKLINNKLYWPESDPTINRNVVMK